MSSLWEPGNLGTTLELARVNDRGPLCFRRLQLLRVSHSSPAHALKRVKHPEAMTRPVDAGVRGQDGLNLAPKLMDFQSYFFWF